MIERELIDFIQDILDTINAIERFVFGLCFEEFEQDDKTIFAVARAIEIIGEAVKNVPEYIRNKYPEISWKAIAGMRDKLIHQYWGADVQVLWKTTQQDVSQLKVLITKVMEEALQNEE